MTMRVGLDATPLLGPRTGVGHYVAELVAALSARDHPEALVLVPFTWRGTGQLPAVAPVGARIRCGRRRAPARLLQAAWARSAWPPVEWLAGGVDVFHATNFVAPPARRAALAVTIHDLAYLRFPELVTEASRRYRSLVPRALARGAVVCAPTASVAAEVADAYRLDPARVVVTPLGVGPAWSAAAAPDPGWLAERGLPGRYMLFLGSREPRKGLGTLLDAYRALRARDREAPPLALVGPAGWGEPLDLSGLDGAVVTRGYLPDEDLPALLAGAAAVAFPSRYEGFGLPPLQALACGTPVVCSDLPALREVLGAEAAFVPVGDAGALAAALGAVLAAGGGERARAARRARASSFTWERCAAATAGAYDRAREVAR